MCRYFQPRDSGGQNNVVLVKASDFEVFEALAVDSVGTESAKTGTVPDAILWKYSDSRVILFCSYDGWCLLPSCR